MIIHWQKRARGEGADTKAIPQYILYKLSLQVRALTHSDRILAPGQVFLPTTDT